MIRKKIITKSMDAGYEDDIIIFPQNNTLYVDQFTDKAPYTDEDRGPFRPRNMKDVFDHYQPCVEDIELKTENGESVIECFFFHSIEDFDDKQLIQQSELLSELKAKMDVHGELIQKFQFLHEDAFLRDIKQYQKELSQWVRIFECEGKNEDEILDNLKSKRNKAKECLRDNLFTVRNEIQRLEKTYRTLDSFFANTGQDRVDFLTLMNTNFYELGQFDSEDTLSVREELEKHNEGLLLNNSYSLLVVPGFIGYDYSIRMWAQTAYRNKVVMFTDFKDNPIFPILKESLERAKLQGTEAYMGNLVITCNYLNARRRSHLANEDDDLYIPASAALAGRLTNTEEIPISQGAEGRTSGVISHALGTRIDLRKAEIATLIDMGVIPMVEMDGQVAAFSDRSLYNGRFQPLQTYPFVRTFDWICKVLQNYFNVDAFMFWDYRVKQDAAQFVNDFLTDFKGTDKAVKGYTLKKIERDPLTKDIRIEVWLKHQVSDKYYSLMLEGHNTDHDIEWQHHLKTIQE